MNYIVLITEILLTFFLIFLNFDSRQLIFDYQRQNHPIGCTLNPY